MIRLVNHSASADNAIMVDGEFQKEFQKISMTLMVVTAANDSCPTLEPSHEDGPHH
jgi:hypothetical protein